MESYSRSGYAAIPARTSEEITAEGSDSVGHTTAITVVKGNLSETALHVDQSFKRWTRTIAERVRLKRDHAKKMKAQKLMSRHVIEDRDREKEVQIMASVFNVWHSPEDRFADGKGKKNRDESPRREVKTLDHEPPLTRESFAELVERVRDAIDRGIQPRLNSKGSSGSYFARDSSRSTLAIFKPKDEEPYGRLNPKFTKWIHRNFLSKIIPFGRACLIPQLSYLSEAAASLLDRRLELHIVPRTECVSLSSPAFFYDWIDRERAKSKGKIKGRKLPEKPGSFQVFLKGYKDAALFLRDHPYPGRPLSQTLDTSSRRKKRLNLLAPLQCLCGRAEAEDDEYDERLLQQGTSRGSAAGSWGWGGEMGAEEGGEHGEQFKWTEDTMSSFREELEKLVILDFLIRNTDRGLDNFMFKGCSSCEAANTVEGASSIINSQSSRHPPMVAGPSLTTSEDEGNGLEMNGHKTPQASKAHIHIAAIDNSLAFPHQHPLGWRSYTYGWLYLPLSLIGQPWSDTTRENLLPLLTSPTWWAQTTLDLRKLFSIDPDFKEKMFMKQMAVIKGQAWNVVQSLLGEEEGPLELCRRPKKLVWDDLIEVADDEITREQIAATAAPPLPTPSPEESPCQSPRRSLSSTVSGSPLMAKPILLPSPSSPTMTTASAPSTLPMPLQRVSSEKARRPQHRRGPSLSSVVSASNISEDKFGSITGVNMMQHLDRVEAEERGMKKVFGSGIEQRLNGGVDFYADDFDDDEEHEADVNGDGARWGVRSENDLRHQGGTSFQSNHSKSTYGSIGRKARAREAVSFDIERNLPTTVKAPDRVANRHRSGSLNLSRSTTLGEPSRISKTNRANKAEMSTNDGPDDKLSRSWLGGFSEEVGEPDSDQEDNDHVEESKRMVVVVERLESVQNNSRFTGWW